MKKKKLSLTLSIQALKNAAGSSLLAFKWLPYKSGAASVYEQVWQCWMWPAAACQGQKAYHSCQCPWGPHVLSPVPSEVFSASKASSPLFICLLGRVVWNPIFRSVFWF